MFSWNSDLEALIYYTLDPKPPTARNKLNQDISYCSTCANAPGVATMCTYCSDQIKQIDIVTNSALTLCTICHRLLELGLHKMNNSEQQTQAVTSLSLLLQRTTQRQRHGAPSSCCQRTRNIPMTRTAMIQNLI
jgi:hypothetical protein